jgi:hypothetical protein
MMISFFKRQRFFAELLSSNQNRNRYAKFEATALERKKRNCTQSHFLPQEKPTVQFDHSSLPFVLWDCCPWTLIFAL